MRILQTTITAVALLVLSACQSLPGGDHSLFDDLGGQAGIDNIVNNFVVDMQHNHAISPHFEDSNMTRFRDKFSEHLCHISGGPCNYSGDTMLQIHQGMNINEAQFNQVVELMIEAMDEANVAIGPRNRLLALLAPARSDIIYQ